MKALKIALAILGFSASASAQSTSLGFDTNQRLLPVMTCAMDASPDIQFTIQIEDSPGGYRDLHLVRDGKPELYRVSGGGTCLSLDCPPVSDTALSDDTGSIFIRLTENGAKGQIDYNKFTCQK